MKLKLYSFALYAQGENEDRYGLISCARMCMNEEDAKGQAENLCHNVFPESEGYSLHDANVRVVDSWIYNVPL